METSQIDFQDLRGPVFASHERARATCCLLGSVCVCARAALSASSELNETTR